MCPTPLGRIQTRVAIITGPAILGTILSLLSGRPDWIVLIGVYLLLGVALDAGVYSWVIRYQPPWMTGVLALVEYGLLLILADVLELELTIWEATALYWASWVIAALTKIVVLPIISLTYLESSTEFRHASWSIPASQASVPVLASEADLSVAPAGVVAQASGVQAVPDGLERKPGLSGVGAIPAAPEEAGG
jgi:hypothetical protein